LHFVLHAFAAGYAGLATAFADPYISIDPSFANAADYSIVVSQGMGNSQTSASATPELASFTLIGIAFCTAALLRGKAVGQKMKRVN
jgi:hypothetical protein